jgi:hypothetical protein
MVTDCEKQSTYPDDRKRSGYFARFTRGLFASDAISRFGQDAVLLAVYVASREDQLHYRHAPRLWRAEIMTVLNFGSNKRMLAARKTAVDCGLLFYRKRTQRKAAEYWTMVPDWMPWRKSGVPSGVPERNVKPPVAFRSGTSEAVSCSGAERQTERQTERILNPVPKKKKKADAFDAFKCDLPEQLNTDAFREAWRSWCQHRREIRKPLTPTTTQKQLKKLASLGAVHAVAAIEHSISGGWTGIFEPSKPQPPVDTRPTLADRPLRDVLRQESQR